MLQLNGSLTETMWTHRRSGQNHPRSPEDHREPYERDRTRVIHSPAFRRLQGKTQILGTNTDDFHRTRLTHSLEVASIASSLVKNLHHHPAAQAFHGLLPTDDLIQTISLLHDIGHPPFGHGGETALNFIMHEHGGFESNGQTLRLLTQLENSYGAHGLDLTRRTLLGILKYPVNRSRVLAPTAPVPTKCQTTAQVRINDWLPPKAYFNSEEAEVDWLLSVFDAEDRDLFQSLSQEPQGMQHGKTAYHSFDCSIMNIADDIAYGVHDLEDAIHLQLIQRDQVDTEECRDLLKQCNLSDPNQTLLNQLFSSDVYQRKQSIGEIVNYLITSIKIVQTNEAFQENIFKYKADLISEALALLNYLKNTIFRYVIDAQFARQIEHQGQQVILQLFDAISDKPATFLDDKHRHWYERAQEQAAANRIICDYISNMTDNSAYRLHQAL